jgi:anaerobic selenocysteine-containing dehydrogenase
VDLKAKHGAESLVVQTGWPYVRHPMIHLLHRFCRAYGTPNLATVASLCEASGRMGRALVWGSSYSPDLSRVKTLLVWGANPPRTAPPWAYLVTNIKRKAKAQGGALVVIDPVRTEIADKADLYVRIRPGTDGAFALGMARHILATSSRTGSRTRRSWPSTSPAWTSSGRSRRRGRRRRWPRRVAATFRML